MKTLIATLLLALAGTASAGCRLQHGDDMRFDGDKRAHFGWSIIPGAAVELGNEALRLDLGPVQRFGLAMIPGTLREIKTGCSSNTAGGYSWQDQAYNALGVLTGMALGNGTVVLLRRNGIDIFIEWD